MVLLYSKHRPYFKCFLRLIRIERLPLFFGLDGVLYSMPVSDILTFVIAAVIIVKTYRELNTENVQNS